MKKKSKRTRSLVGFSVFENIQVWRLTVILKGVFVKQGLIKIICLAKLLQAEGIVGLRRIKFKGHIYVLIVFA